MLQTELVQLVKNVKTPTEWQKLTKRLLTTDINIFINNKLYELGRFYQAHLFWIKFKKLNK